jgi:hypothetical protein
MVKVNMGNGKILWQTYTTPNTGFSGVAVWGSSPAVDPAAGVVYYTTGKEQQQLLRLLASLPVTVQVTPFWQMQKTQRSRCIDPATCWQFVFYSRCNILRHSKPMCCCTAFCLQVKAMRCRKT